MLELWTSDPFTEKDGCLERETTLSNTFETFAKNVKESCEKHARRKGYTSGGADDDNQLLNITKSLGINRQHAVAEIIYKAAEVLKSPRRVIAEKIAGWAFCLWKDLPPEE